MNDFVNITTNEYITSLEKFSVLYEIIMNQALVKLNFSLQLKFNGLWLQPEFKAGGVKEDMEFSTNFTQRRKPDKKFTPNKLAIYICFHNVTFLY